MSKKFLVVALASTVLTWSAAAQTSASSQTSASGSSQTSVSANGTGAQANSSNSANASQTTSVSHQDHDKGKPAGSQSSASAAGSAANSAAASTGSSSANLANGTTMNAVLTKSVDARHAKAGDEVAAKVTQDVKSDGKVVVPKNSKLVGHVTEAKAKEKGAADAQSSLGMVFDHAVLKNGEQVPTHVVIQALAAAQSNAAASAMNEPMGAPMVGSAGGSARSGGGLVGGVGSTVGGTAGVAGNAAGDVGRTAGSVVNTSASAAGSAAGSAGRAGGALSATGQLTSHSTGVIGLSGLQLASSAAGAAQGSVITSTSKTVKLDSGTQMLLRVANQ